MKRKISFIDHAAHKLTRSSEFFCRLLRERFELDVFYINPGSDLDHEQIEAICLNDIVVIWQMDFLAPIFIGRDMPTIVVPMYDGSANMPDLHWLWSSKAYFICFSWTLNEKLRLLGCKTFLVRYYKKPVEETSLPDFDDLRCFLWQRRPEEGINGDMVVRLLDGQISKFHIHDAPDYPAIEGSRYYGSRKNLSITISKWFDDPKGYETCLSGANVFISPRRAEGIGMAHLEAMARGMLVLAHDQPTHTEYLANWVNGILFDADQIGHTHLPKDLARSMARSGWLSAIEGRRIWEDSRSQMLDYVGQVHAPRSRVDDDMKHVLGDLVRAYNAGCSEYVAFLNVHCRAIIEMAGYVVVLSGGSAQATALGE